MTPRILVCAGTRPEAIKLAPVIRWLRRDEQLDTRLVLTGQHREMVRQVLTTFGLTADADLDVMQPGQTPTEILHRVSAGIDEILATVRPDAVVVQGDTTSAMAVGIAAFHRRIPVAHVEAGLRSGDRKHPFPEEVNRRILSSVADLHLAPTPAAAANLTREGIDPSSITVTGNTAVDAVLDLVGGTPTDLDGTVLITLHRRESWLTDVDGTPALDVLATALARIATRNPGLRFVYPVHPNPMVRKLVESALGGSENVSLIDPLPYPEFVRAMARARVIISDSGGVQEEAPTLGTPVLVPRLTTERPEGLEFTNRLVGFDPARLEAAFDEAVAAAPPKPERRPYPSPFGDGRAAERTHHALLHLLGRGERIAQFQPPRGAEAHV